MSDERFETGSDEMIIPRESEGQTEYIVRETEVEFMNRQSESPNKAPSTHRGTKPSTMQFEDKDVIYNYDKLNQLAEKRKRVGSIISNFLIDL